MEHLKWSLVESTDMIHSWIQTILAKAQQITFGQAFQIEEPLDPDQRDFKRLAYVQTYLVLTTTASS